MVKRGHRQSSVGGVLLRMEEEVRRSIFHVACRGFPMFPLGHRWTDNIRQKSESLSVHGHISRGVFTWALWYYLHPISSGYPFSYDLPYMPGDSPHRGLSPTHEISATTCSTKMMETALGSSPCGKFNYVLLRSETKLLQSYGPFFLYYSHVDIADFYTPSYNFYIR